MVRETPLLQQLIIPQDGNISLAALTTDNGVKRNRCGSVGKREVSVTVDFKPGSGSHESKNVLYYCCAYIFVCSRDL